MACITKCEHLVHSLERFWLHQSLVRVNYFNRGQPVSLHMVRALLYSFIMCRREGLILSGHRRSPEKDTLV